MNTKMSLVGAILLVSTSAFASGGIRLNCPAGSVQQLAVGQDLACMKGGKVVAGPVVMLYPSGKKMAEGQIEAEGDRTFRTGTWTLFDEKGVKTHVIEFQRGNFHGKWTEFHANGQVKTIVSYDKGMKVGEAQHFDLTGKPVRVVVAK